MAERKTMKQLPYSEEKIIEEFWSKLKPKMCPNNIFSPKQKRKRDFLCEIFSSFFKFLFSSSLEADEKYCYIFSIEKYFLICIIEF